MNRETMKNEALKRMETIELMPEVITNFKDKDTVYVSERQNEWFNAILYSTDSYEGLNEVIQEFEKDYGGLVYHVQLTHYMEFGDLFSLFYVSKNENEWEDDNELLERGETLAYVHNMSAPFCSELGYIGFNPSMGGVERVW